MAGVRWIKLTVDMFDNRKIKHLRRLPDGNNIVLIWVMLLTMAGRCNSSGMIFLTENIPYTPKMLADELDFEENTVQLALTALEQLNMIVTDNGFFSIAGWDEYQNIEGMDKIREQNRLRKQRQREKEKLVQERVERLLCDGRVTSRDSHATDIDIDIDKEEDKEVDKDNISSSAKPKKATKNKHGAYKNVLLTENEFENLANSFGIELRDKAIAFLDEYIEEKGYKSKSHNLAIRRWVIEAVQQREVKPTGRRKEIVPKWAEKDNSWMKQYLDEDKTAKNNPEIAERAENLKRSLQGG